MRGSTQLEILKLLRVNNALSRAEIADKLNMNRGNITRAVAGMLQRKWLLECQAEDDGQVRRGQPPILLKINPEAFSAIGITVSTTIEISLVNAIGELQSTNSISNLLPEKPDECIENIIKEIERLLKSSKGCNLGIGLATSGIMHKDPEKLYDNYYIGGRTGRLSLINSLENLNAGPVFTSQISSVYAIAEYQARPELRKNKTFFCISDRLNFGGIWEGLMISSKRLKKLSIQHVKIKDSNYPCYCGEKGCLVTVAGFRSICDKLKGFVPGERGHIPITQTIKERHELFNKIQNKDEQALTLLKEAAQAIYEATEPFVLAFQPDALFFDDWLTLYPENGIDYIRDKFAEYSQKAGYKSWEVMDSVSYGKQQGVIGAAILVLERNYGLTTSNLRIKDFTEHLFN